MKHTFAAGGVVLNRKGEVLVVSQNGNSWSLPKGHVDKGESALTAAKREIYEESGVKQLKLIKELGSYDRYRIGLDGQDDKSEFKTITLFLFKTDEESLNPQDKKNPEARWVSKEEVSKLLTHKKDADFFTHLMPKL
jgi:ADP-ribose pyrophosphatase YjhB (NUDIX family)